MFGKVLTVSLIICSIFVCSISGCSSPKTASSMSVNTTTGISTSTKTKTGSGAGTGTATATSDSNYGIKVTQNGNTLLFLSLADIDNLATVTEDADGKSYTGPTILSILSLAGVDNFSQITIVGFSKGRLATAELPVAKSDLNSTYIVRKTNQNTYSLATPDVDSNSWIIDVNELRVQ